MNAFDGFLIAIQKDNAPVVSLDNVEDTSDSQSDSDSQSESESDANITSDSTSDSMSALSQ